MPRNDSHLRRGRRLISWSAALGLAVTGAVTTTPAAADGNGAERAAAVAAHWDDARIAAAQPRELVLDANGVAWQRQRDGRLVGHGHGDGRAHRPTITRTSPEPEQRGKPGGGGGGGGGGNQDTTAPSISAMSPGQGATVGAAVDFSAVITDASGLKTVTFTVVYPSGSTQNFTPTASGDTYTVSLSGFTNGSWGWYVTAKDNGSKGGNTAVSSTVGFTVDTGGGTPPPGGDVTNSRWTFGGAVQTAAGRIYFEMPSQGPNWAGYVCSGTVMTDGSNGRSVIITAAHCVYDDVNKVFARNVLFIPDQDGTTGAGTDTNCSNDPLGCWAPDHGVVDVNWTTRTFPDNIPWDYAYYVVGDDAHAGSGSGGPLDTIAGDLPVDWSTPQTGATNHALGYSQSADPYFMYCKEAMGTEGSANWWMPNCGLSGGSSGGPWIQPMDEATGTGSIISVNSWGYSTGPGMAGPKLSGTSAQCIFNAATGTTVGGVANRGLVVSGC